MDLTTLTSEVTSPYKTHMHQKSIQKPEGYNTRASLEKSHKFVGTTTIQSLILPSISLFQTLITPTLKDTANNSSQLALSDLGELYSGFFTTF